MSDSQGTMDRKTFLAKSVALVAGGAALDREVETVLEAFASKPFIFNLGHGILPETPIAHVESMLRRIRGK